MKAVPTDFGAHILASVPNCLRGLLGQRNNTHLLKDGYLLTQAVYLSVIQTTTTTTKEYDSVEDDREGILEKSRSQIGEEWFRTSPHTEETACAKALGYCKEKMVPKGLKESRYDWNERAKSIWTIPLPCDMKDFQVTTKVRIQ